MSRFSPQVLPERQADFGDFAGSLANTLEQRRERKRQEGLDQQRTDQLGVENRRADERLDLDRQQQAGVDLARQVELYNSGYRAGEPPDMHDPTAALAQLVAQQRGNQTQGQPAEPQPLPPGSGNLTQAGAGRPSMDMQPGDAMPPQGGAPPTDIPRTPSLIRQAGLQFYQVPGGGGYMDPSATPEGRAVARDERTAGREDARDERTFTRQGERDDRLDARALEREKAQNALWDERDQRTAGRESARDDRRYQRDLGLEREKARLKGEGGAAGDPLGNKTLEKRFEQVNSQVGNAQHRLDQAGADISTRRAASDDPAKFEADSSGYHAVASELDSLRGVQGRYGKARGGDVAAARGIQREIGGTAYKQELQGIDQKRQRALNLGIPQDKVDAAYAADAAALGMKYRGSIGQ